MTVLGICVVRWHEQHSTEHYVAVRGGVLRVRGGQVVQIATRQAIVSDNLSQLRDQVLVDMRKNSEAERSARAGALSLEHAAIRQIYRYLRPGDQPSSVKPDKVFRSDS